MGIKIGFVASAGSVFDYMSKKSAGSEQKIFHPCEYKHERGVLREV